MKISLRIFLGALACFILFSGCNKDKTTAPSTTKDRPALAGGGRLDDNDPSSGKVDSSGFSFPDQWPYPGQSVLFYSDMNCAGQPYQKVIRDSAEWRQWWESAWTCLLMDPDTLWGQGDSVIPGSPNGDTNWHDTIPPDSIIFDTIPRDSIPIDSFPVDSFWKIPPTINFDSHVVVVIALEASDNFGRSIWIDEVTASEVRYTVSSLGEDCLSMMERPQFMMPTSPTIAVMVPRPLDEPVTWTRRDTSWSCSWEPDPNEPLTIYYTDSPCELGLQEQVITDSNTYGQLMATATTCDSLRWWDMMNDSNGVVGCGFGGGYLFDVDFATHAVIVLRAGVQSRWGGGVWLNSIDANGDSTVIEYTAMQPGVDCPVADGLAGLNPTVLIRIPKPTGTTVSWIRHEETIDCAWTDSSGTVSPGNPGNR